MTEVAPSRPSAGLSVSAENLLTLDSDAVAAAAALDDLIESEVIVGDDSDDEFAFNGEVKDTEEIYVQNGPRGPSLTVGHVTIEHSYCTPDDDDVAVKLVDPDRFSDFFLLEDRPAVSVAGDSRPLQLFSDMRQCLGAGAVSYLQVSPAVLSSLQQGPRRLESLTEEDETAAQETPPPHPPPPPVHHRPCADAAAVSVASDAGASTAAAEMSADGGGASVWGVGASQPVLQQSWEPPDMSTSGAAVSVVSPIGDESEMSGPLSLVGIVMPSTASSASDVALASVSAAETAAADVAPSDAAERHPLVSGLEVSDTGALCDGAVADAVVTASATDNVGSVSDVTSDVRVTLSENNDPLHRQNGSVPSDHAVTIASEGVLNMASVNGGVKSDPADFPEDTPASVDGQDATTSNGVAAVSPAAVVTSGGTAVKAAPAGEGAGQTAAVSTVEGGNTANGSEGTEINSFEGAAAAGAEGTATVTAELSLVSVDESPPQSSTSRTDSLPVLKIDESIELCSEGSVTSDRSSSSYSSTPRLGQDGKAVTPRAGKGSQSARSGTGVSVSARIQEEGLKTRSPVSAREEKRILSNYATLPRSRAKKSPPGSAKDLPAVPEIAKKPATNLSATRSTPASKRKSLEKNASELRRSESCNEDGSSGSSTLGRRKKNSAEAAAAAELKRSADKYGTIGRKKKKAAVESTAASSKGPVFTSEEMKKSADTFATLGRRKKTAAAAKEEHPAKSAASVQSRPTAAPAKQAPAKTAAAPVRPAATSAKSTASTTSKSAAVTAKTSTAGKSATISAVRSAAAPPKSNTRSGATSTAAAPTRRPAAARAAGRGTARPSAAGKTRERTLICLETGCQTMLTGGDLAGACLRQRPTVSSGEVDCQVELPTAVELQQAAELQRLRAEAERARATLDQLQQLQAELESARQQLTEESADKLEVQEELSRTTSTVQQMMARMEAVEAELQQHQQGLQSAERRAQTADAAAEQLQHQLDQAQLTIRRLTEDLDKSVAAQKTLLQQVQETEAESRELHEFMQLEKNALVDALRESENEMAAVRTAADDQQRELEAQERRCGELTRLAERRADEMSALKDDLSHLQSRTKELLLCQGAGVSGASVALSQVASRLETALDSLLPLNLRQLPHAASVPARLADGSAPVSRHRRSASLVSPLAGPPRSLSQMVRALDLPAAETLADERPPLAGGDSLQELAVRHLLDGRDSPEGQECYQRAESGEVASVGLDEQVQLVDSLVERLVQAAVKTHQNVPREVDVTSRPAGAQCAPDSELRDRLARLEAENCELRSQVASNGSSNSPDTRPSPAQTPDESASLHAELQRRDRQLEELRQKYLKHKQILTENVQKAESEIQTLDEIIDYVISSLGAVPEVVRRESTLWKLWLDLDGPNKTQTRPKLNGTSPLSDLNANAADIVKV